uniref:Fibronectin type-III domain-containing protein n=1 Tax=candidate division CPR3 bacterium TaxID=2268181 RepID=A0A7V3JAL4_UNCC3
MTKNPNIQYRDSKQIPIFKFSKPKVCFEHLRLGPSGLFRASRFEFQVLVLSLFLSLFIFSYTGAARAVQKINVHQPKIDEKKKTITISWDAVSGADFYKIYKSEGGIGTKGTDISGQIKNQTTFSVTGSKAEGSSYYVVSAYKTGSSTPFAQGQTSMRVSLTAPSVPTDTSSGSTDTPVPIGAPFPNEQSSTTLPEHVNIIYKWAAGIGSLLATLMIIFAGFKYATSSGNPDALQDAKDTIIGSLVGLSIIILSYLLLQTIGVSV